MLLADFRVIYPEFGEASDEFVQAHLDQQVGYLDVEVLGSQLDEAHGLRAAHSMALSPHGQAAKLSSSQGESTYGRQLETLNNTLGYGFRAL